MKKGTATHWRRRIRRQDSTHNARSSALFVGQSNASTQVRASRRFNDDLRRPTAVTNEPCPTDKFIHKERRTA